MMCSQEIYGVPPRYYLRPIAFNERFHWSHPTVAIQYQEILSSENTMHTGFFSTLQRLSMLFLIKLEGMAMELNHAVFEKLRVANV